MITPGIKNFGGWLVLVTSLVLVASLVWASFWSVQAVTAARVYDLESASQHAQRAIPVVKTYSDLTLGLVPDLVVWHKGLWLLAQAPQLREQAQASIERAPDEAAPSLATVFSQPLMALEKITEQLPKTWLLKLLLPQSSMTQLQELGDVAQLLHKEVMTGSQTWVILFQNSQEIRATGGFMGSLAFVSLENGSLTKIEVQDIYQPAGQLTGMTEPPPGVKEYLSGGKGWQLSDANWSPDFPQTAQTILQMLETSGYPAMNGVLAVNLGVAQTLLEVTGPVELPDYQTQVTSDTVAEVLRSNRSDFFAGSMAKQHLLASFVTQLKHQILTLPPDKQLIILQKLLSKSQGKEIQFFARSSELQTFFAQQRAAGEQLPQDSDPDFFLQLLESNVGINKANQGIIRSWQVEVQPTQTQLSVIFTNTQQPSDRPALSPSIQGARHLHYVNYQRLYVLPDTTVEGITYQGQPVTTWDEQLIMTSTGRQLKELGFLLITQEQQTTQLDIDLSHPELKAGNTVLIPHQSGLPAYDVTLTWNNTPAGLVTSTADLEFSLP